MNLFLVIHPKFGSDVIPSSSHANPYNSPLLRFPVERHVLSVGAHQNAQKSAYLCNIGVRAHFRSEPCGAELCNIGLEAHFGMSVGQNYVTSVLGPILGQSVERNYATSVSGPILV